MVFLEIAFLFTITSETLLASKFQILIGTVSTKVHKHIKTKYGQ